MTIRTARAPRLDGVRALFTTRYGGTSQGDFAEANLALHVGDNPADVAAQRTTLHAMMAAPVVFVDQRHTADVHVLPRDHAQPFPRPSGEAAPVADAVVTDREDVAVAVMVADCVPVLLSDPEAGVVAAAHAGRRGLLSGILQNTLGQMERLGADPSRTQAAIGPSICAKCYEVPESMREDCGDLRDVLWTSTSWGTPSLDLRAGARYVLEQEGLPALSIDDEYPCTLEDEAFFSYRRHPQTGRCAGVIRRAEAVHERSRTGV